MITELNKLEANPIGGRKIDVVDYNIRNYRLHQVLEQASRLLLFCVECDSNNTNSKSIPRDVRKIRAQWDIVKDEFEFSMSHNNAPTGSHEYAFTIALLDQKEIQRVRNVKMKRVVSEVFNALRVLLSVDSANTQGDIDDADALDIREVFKLVDDTMARWIGGGKDNADTGLSAPAYEILGEIRPDVDSDWAQVLEPSKAMPAPKLPDTPDTPVSE